MDKIEKLLWEARSEIIGGLVVAAVLGVLSLISKNSAVIGDFAIRILGVKVSLWLILLILATGVVFILFYRLYRRRTDSVQPKDLIVEPETQVNASVDNPSKMGEYYSCFVSYSSKDYEFAEKLQTDLKHHGIDVWFAPEDLPIGAKTRIALDKSVLEKHKLLLVLSRHSVASDWVEQEVEAAFEKERETDQLVLFPIRIDDAVMSLKVGWAAHIKRTRNIGDFRQWMEPSSYQNWLQRLLRDLRVETKKNNGQ